MHRDDPKSLGARAGHAPRRPRDPRAARHRAHREELAHRGAAADADEQPRSGRRRESAGAGRLRRHRPRRAQLGMLRRHRRGAARTERRRVAADPVGQAGGRVQDARRRAARADRQLEPRAEVGDVGALQRTRPQGPHDVRPDDGRVVDLHRQPGHRAGHVRDVRRGGPPAFRRRARGQVDPDRGPGRHGRRATAGRDDGRGVDARDRMPAVAHRDAPAHALSRQTGEGPRRRARDHQRCLRDEETGERRPGRQRGRDPAGTGAGATSSRTW